jgi:flagellar protein FliS
MNMRDPVRSYRESAVRGASPLGLIVILYDEMVRSIRKSRDCFERGDIEGRGKALMHVVEVIGYLQSILDFEKGGDVARNLASFYNFMRMKLLEIHIKPSPEGLDMLAAEFAKLSAAWRQVDEAQSQPSAPGAMQSIPSLGVTSAATEAEANLAAMGR